MIQQPIYYTRNTALYCILCKNPNQSGYNAVYEQPRRDLTCDICMQPLYNEDKANLERLVGLVSLV